MSKFFANLMAQTRKRSHEQSEAANGTQNGSKGESLVSPSKRMSTITSGKTVSNHKGGSDGPAARVPMKLVRSDKNNGTTESELFFVASKGLKTFRRDNEAIDLKKLARAPQKLLKQNASLYNEISRFVKTPKSEPNGKANGNHSAESNGVDLSSKSTANGSEENGKHAATNGVQEDEDMEKPTVNGANGEVVVLD